MKRGVTGLFLLLATACVVGGCGAKKDAQIDASAQAAEGDAAEETADTQTVRAQTVPGAVRMPRPEMPETGQAAALRTERRGKRPSRCR